MSDHYRQIYQTQASRYDNLVAREDYEGNILVALNDIQAMQDANVVEFGAGTGRLTRLLAPLVRSIRAFDASPHMLEIATKTLQESGATNWSVEVGDNRTLPVESGTADIAIEGWSFGHFQGWYPDSWRDEAGKAIAEMGRVLRVGGTAILLETMGTGFAKPMPPTRELAAFYAWVETECGFSSQTIRTDYRFESIDEYDELIRFFFGDETADVADIMPDGDRVIVPENTGIWWKIM
jgi:ubiquinone/menaquinone biosynthesis C-methylase UbiE